MLASSSGFGIKLSNDVSQILKSDPGCHGNKMSDKIGYNSVCIIWDVVKQQI